MAERFLCPIRYALSATGYDPLMAPLSVLSTNDKNAGNTHSSYRIARSGYLIFILFLTLYTLPSTLYAATNLPVGSPAANLEEGKALFESGRYQDAISKFIMVLRSDPQNPDARRYLRQSVDQLRQNPTAEHRGLDGTPPPTAQKEMREMLQKRAALTLDLTAIPGVQVNMQNAVTQVIIETGQIFDANNGGLKEEGVPILDRVSAWLKTFGQQPIIIHCYPEELQTVTSTGSLFLRRYSELYNFFIEERKLSPQRLISADLLADDAASGRVTPQASNVGTASRIVIETLGSQSSLLDGAMPSAEPHTAIARWLEFAVISQRDAFNPEEGEWATLDLAALSRTGLRSWAFSILPEDHASDSHAAVYELSGKGNVLKRLDWDGRNPKTGSFVPTGGYVARITATDSDGTIKTEQVAVRVDNTSAPETLTNKEEPTAATSEPVAKKAKKRKKKKAAAVVVAAPTPTPPTPEPETSAAVDAPTPTSVAAPVPASEPAAAEPTTPEPADDSSHAIWKQVLQFDAGSGDLAPSLAPSLERIGKTLEVYPLQKVRIVGFASTKEDGALLLAKKRAQSVRSVLLDQYHVDEKRVIIGGARVNDGDGMSKAELSITN